MTPCLTFLNTIDRVLGNAVPVGQRLARKSVGVGEYVNGSLIGKPFHATCFTSCLSAFCSAIGVILGSGAKKKMSRVAASGVVAMVANKHAVGDWPLVKLVRKSVHLYDLPSNLEPAIAICVTCASVLPTFSVRAMRQKFKEAIGWVVGPPRQPAFYRAVPPSPFSRWGRGEILATAFAGKNKGRVFALLGAEPRSIELRGLYSKVLTAPLTNYVVRGILGAHMNHLSCAMPPTVPAVRGLSYAFKYTKFRMTAGIFEGVTV